jgi:hypothetical protein
MLSSGSLKALITEKGRDCFNKMPTPLLFLCELLKKLYEQYGFIRKELVTSCELDTPAELQSLMSDSKIMSDLMLTIPCIFRRWFVVPTVDILRELQLIDDIVRFGKLLPKLVIVQSTLMKIRIFNLKLVAGASLPIVTGICA